MNESLKLGKLYSEKCFVECWRKGRNGMCLCFRRNKANTVGFRDLVNKEKEFNFTEEWVGKALKSGN